MICWSVAERELRLAARRARTYRARALTAFVVLVMSLGMLYLGFGRLLSPGSAGRSLFMLLSLVGGLYVLLDGMLMTADCLSQEKREGTIGLLFLAGLRSHEIVSAKLIARTANSAYCLLAALPALGIALFLGGVTGLDILRMTLALANGLFFSAALGLFISSISRGEGQALRRALFSTVTVALVIPGLGWAWSVFSPSGEVHPAVLWTNPAGAFLEALGLRLLPPTSTLGFASMLGSAHLIAWGFLLAASLTLRASWPDPAGSKISSRPSSARRELKSEAALKTRQARRRSSLDDNPVIWLGSRRAARNLGVWPFLVVAVAAWALGWACARGYWLTLPIYVLSTVLLHLSLVAVVLLRTCRAPAEDQRSGVLEILLTTPLGDDVYLQGRMLSVKRHTLGPLAFIVAADLGLLAAGLWQIGSLSFESLGWIVTFIGFLFILLIDLYVLSWVGLWQGLKTANTGRAVRRTIFYVLLLRWILLLVVLAVVGVMTQGRIFQSPAGGMIATVGYGLLLMMTASYYCALARSELEDNLRALALGFEMED